MMVKGIEWTHPFRGEQGGYWSGYDPITWVATIAGIAFVLHMRGTDGAWNLNADGIDVGRFATSAEGMNGAIEYSKIAADKAKHDKPEHRVELFDVILKNGAVRHGETAESAAALPGTRVNGRIVCRACGGPWHRLVHGC
ncbi:hypothetical protein SEA_LILPHARAOH_75 [Mycobacterium phage LilPharaoh]|uniref:Uncharacterized protein n=1 Tax=Mycobacterium phage Amelie TaxID=1913035 RepID=A0A1J0GRA8_9CAUD|nr:hypothetical protein AVV01_gp76 [Mycobacterium phage Enkosi]YP_009952592.1 hypothetical protein I5G92_gp74 [Mycobacterium phage Amelie]ATN90528.1 hypothetical protein SEA_LILPHARAOH_75 [Mycobacterium phage LilPharaoh]AVP42652.1 hypothetical protein SEA_SGTBEANSPROUT_75 [Mycobacterium phage SgtBeansprout]AXC37180.1 hypothetical protein SEA_BIGLEBOPS_74 [Mycobacterium phage Biglebops]QGJ93359.1 hypothetical protein PBI_MDAVU_75 [Mycobacterium phage Mdavu]UQS94474.1 hypothetical protein SEA_N